MQQRNNQTPQSRRVLQGWMDPVTNMASTRKNSLLLHRSGLKRMSFLRKVNFCAIISEITCNWIFIANLKLNYSQIFFFDKKLYAYCPQNLHQTNLKQAKTVWSELINSVFGVRSDSSNICPYLTEAVNNVLTFEITHNDKDVGQDSPHILACVNQM